MTATTYSTSANQDARHARGAPHIAGTAVAFTPHRYNQDEVARELTEFAEPGFMRFAQTAGVDNRSLALPLSRYPKLSGFTEANDAYLEVAVDLGEQAIRKALAAANIEPHEVDTIVMVSSTGIAVPTIDARLMSRSDFGPTSSVSRYSGSVAWRALPGWHASTTTCTATRGMWPCCCPSSCARSRCSAMTPRSRALIGVSLFGDGAAAVVVTGADRIPLGPTDIRSARPRDAQPGGSGNRRRHGLERQLQRVPARDVP